MAYMTLLESLQEQVPLKIKLMRAEKSSSGLFVDYDALSVVGLDAVPAIYSANKLNISSDSFGVNLTCQFPIYNQNINYNALAYFIYIDNADKKVIASELLNKPRTLSYYTNPNNISITLFLSTGWSKQ